jgi:hypothetical protein
MKRLVSHMLVVLAVGYAAPALACLEGTKCIKVPKRAYKAPYSVGDQLPAGSFNVLLNSTYHGLPPSDGTFWYVQHERYVFKVTPGTFEVLEDVTQNARRLRR